MQLLLAHSKVFTINEKYLERNAHQTHLVFQLNMALSVLFGALSSRHRRISASKVKLGPSLLDGQ